MSEFLRKLSEKYTDDKPKRDYLGRRKATKADLGRRTPSPKQIEDYIAMQQEQNFEDLLDQYPPTEDTLITKNQGL